MRITGGLDGGFDLGQIRVSQGYLMTYLRSENRLSILLMTGLLGVLMLMALYPGNFIMEPATYLPVHTALEFISILVSFMVFTVGWATANQVKSKSILLLSVTSMTVGLLDFAHTLSFSDMPTFFGTNFPDKAIYFWLSARIVTAVSLVAVPLIADKSVRFRSARFGLLIASVGVATAFYFVFLMQWQHLPRMFIPGFGLTPLKVGLEYAIILLFGVAALLNFGKSKSQNILSFRWLGLASMTMVMSEAFFTFYGSSTDVYALAGHIYKAIGFGFLYRAVFVECVSRPYDEMKRYAKEAKAANETKTQFLANVSHEFRTPLGVIYGFSDLLATSKTLDEESQGWVHTIRRNSEQLRHLIDDLLDLTKVETGRLAVQNEKFSLDEVIEDVIGGFSLPAKEKAIELRLHRQKDLPQTVYSDSVRFRQILVNLVSNAIKFTDKGFVDVDIRCEKDQQGDKHIYVSVRDSGIGISLPQVSRLFRPFSQGDDSMSRRFGGTGLGLSLSRKLANILGGNLWLEFSRPGEGSVFAFSIPVGLKQEEQSRATPTPIFPSPKKTPLTTTLLKDKKILLVDDARDNQLLLERYLKMNGAQVTVASNGKEGVNAATDQAFDLIFMDIQMPEMDGYEATRILRQKGKTLPIVALTAHALKTEKARALRSGFDDYVIKPVTKQKLVDAVLKFSPSRPGPKPPAAIRKKHIRSQPQPDPTL